MQAPIWNAISNGVWLDQGGYILLEDGRYLELE